MIEHDGAEQLGPGTKVTLFPTCLVDALEPDVAMATARVLGRLGCTVDIADGATCCGQPAWNAGHAGPAVDVARTTLRALAASDTDVVVVPAGSCATMMRVFWRELFELAGTAQDRARLDALGGRIRELSEVLAPARDRLPTVTEPPAATVAYHRSCHMLRELRIEDAPEAVLDAVGVRHVDTAAKGRCCGFGGLFSVKLPELSVAMADEVLDAVTDSGAEEVVGCDASCLLHLRTRAEFRGLPLRFRHLAEVVEGAGA